MKSFPDDSRRREEERRRRAPSGRTEDSISTVLDLCDLASASQTADCSSSLSGPVRVRLASFSWLLITPTHNCGAPRSTQTQNKEVCGAGGGHHAEQIGLGGISQALAWDEPSSENLCLSVRMIMI